MDISIYKFLFVNMPETFLNFVFGLLILRGKGIFQEKNNILKLIIATIAFPLLMSIYRNHINSIILTTILGVLTYLIALKILWRTNLRVSFIISTMMMMLVMISEIATMQLMSKLIKNIIQNYGLLHVKALIIWTIPTRIVQIVAIKIVHKLNLTLKNNKILFENWNDIPKSEKVTVHILFRHLIVSVILNSCYSEVFVYTINTSISTKTFDMILYLVLLCSIYFLMSSLQLLLRQTLLEDLKSIFFRGPNKLFKLILESSTEQQISDFQLQLIEYTKQRKDDTNEEKII